MNAPKLLIEFKLKTRKNIGSPWESLPVHFEIQSTGEGVREWTDLLVSVHDRNSPNDPVWEVRWNYVGSLQGHYIAYLRGG